MRNFILCNIKVHQPLANPNCKSYPRKVTSRWILQILPCIILLLVVIITLFGLIDVDAAWNIFVIVNFRNFYNLIFFLLEFRKLTLKNKLWVVSLCICSALTFICEWRLHSLWLLFPTKKDSSRRSKKNLRCNVSSVFMVRFLSFLGSC